MNKADFIGLFCEYEGVSSAKIGVRFGSEYYTKI